MAGMISACWSREAGANSQTAAGRCSDSSGTMASQKLAGRKVMNPIPMGSVDLGSGRSRRLLARVSPFARVVIWVDVWEKS